MMNVVNDSIHQWRRGCRWSVLTALVLSAVACSEPPPGEARQVAERFVNTYYVDNALDSAAQLSGEPLRSLLLKRHKEIDARVDTNFTPVTRPVPDIDYKGGEIVDKATVKVEFDIRPDVRSLTKTTAVLLITKTDDVWRVTELNESME